VEVEGEIGKMFWNELEATKEKVERIVNAILKEEPDCEMVILDSDGRTTKILTGVKQK